jgi:hypothetical protein
MEYFCTKCGAPCNVTTMGVGFDFATLKSTCCSANVMPQIADQLGGYVPGRKDDNEKIRMDLLPFEALEAVAKVLTFGAKKYADNNWKNVNDAEHRYVGALLRHLSAYLKGEWWDEETELSHLSHMATNALFLVYFEEKKKCKQ